MANPCEVYNEWFDEESENVIQELGELINQALEQWGFDPIEVVEGDLWRVHQGAPQGRYFCA